MTKFTPWAAASAGHFEGPAPCGEGRARNLSKPPGARGRSPSVGRDGVGVDVVVDFVVVDVGRDGVQGLGVVGFGVRERSWFGHRSATLNLALRARGLTATSWAVAVTGFLVRTVSLGSLRKAHLTRRSSSEWKLMIAARPPGARTSGSSVKRGVEVAELVVDHDPQGLEDAGRRVDGAVPESPGDALADQLGELPGGPDRLAPPGLDDPPRDPAAEPLFPVVKERLGQLVGRQLLEQLGGGRPRGFGVEPHVERAVGSEAEPAMPPRRAGRTRAPGPGARPGPIRGCPGRPAPRASRL